MPEAALDAPCLLPVGEQAAEGFRANAQVGGELALADRQHQAFALATVQAQQVGGQALGGGAGGQPVDLVDLAVETQAEAFQHAHGQWRMALAGLVQRVAAQSEEFAATLAAGVHRVAAVGHEHGRLGDQLTFAEQLEDMLFAVAGEAQHFHAATPHQQEVFGGVAFAEQQFAALGAQRAGRVAQAGHEVLRQVGEEGDGAQQSQAFAAIWRELNICHSWRACGLQ